MYVSLFAIAVAFLVLGQQVLKNARYKKYLGKYADEHHVEIQSTKRTAASYIHGAVPVAICVICAVYLIFNLNTITNAMSYFAFFVILAIMFGASIITNEINQRIFYMGDVFLLYNEEISFHNIKELNRSKFKASEVILKKGKSFRVSKKQIDELKKLCDEKKIHVKLS